MHWVHEETFRIHVLTPGVDIKQVYNLLQIPKNIRIGKHESQRKIAEKDEEPEHVEKVNLPKKQTRP